MKILHLDCSPREQSHSRWLSAEIVQRLQASAQQGVVIRRDLGREPLPHAEPDYAHALSSPSAATAAEAQEAIQLSEQLIAELEAADRVVIGTPMNNFTVPSVLKAWIDQVLRVGRSIGVDAQGRKVGLLVDRPVDVAIASGGVFHGPQARQPDFLIPYLQAAFACIGITSLRFFPLQGTAFIDENAISAARAAVLQKWDEA